MKERYLEILQATEEIKKLEMEKYWDFLKGGTESGDNGKGNGKGTSSDIRVKQMPSKELEKSKLKAWVKGLETIVSSIEFGGYLYVSPNHLS